jgi:hypothetical protein
LLHAANGTAWFTYICPQTSECLLNLQEELLHSVVADLHNDPVAKQYIYALFISTSHLFCLGYGLATMPGTLVELIVTLVSMTVGSILFLVVVGTLPTAVLEQEVNAAAIEMEGDQLPLPTARCSTAFRHIQLPCCTLGYVCPICVPSQSQAELWLHFGLRHYEAILRELDLQRG